jgi:phage gpG-like protein
MTQKEFQERLHNMEKEFKAFFSAYGPAIAANVAVGLFKKNFQTESFFGEKWQEVKRRQDTWIRNGKPVKNPTRGAGRKRKILTGKTGDLGRSIKIKAVVPGRAVIWSDPGEFRSKQPYGPVHNEGLRAGRGKGFIMPRRQFIGDAPALRQAIADELDRKIKEIIQNQRQ